MAIRTLMSTVEHGHLYPELFSWFW